MAKDINEAKKELEKKMLNNNEKINKYDERKRMSKVNQFEYKVITAMEFSIIPYIILFMSSPLLLKIIPQEIFSIFLACTSLCIGTIGEKILECKFESKKRFEKFTTAKTQAEKLQEEVKNTIELEKAKNRNKALQLSINSSCKDIDILKNKNDVNEEVLSDTLKNKYEELDLLTTQKVLHENFVEEKHYKVLDIIRTGIFGGLFVMLLKEIPFVQIKNYIPDASLNFASFFSSFAIGTVGTVGYMIKRNKDYMKMFNNLNEKLGENSISFNSKNSYKEQLNFDKQINNKIYEVSIIESQLQEQKKLIKSFSDNDEKNKKIDLQVSKNQAKKSNFLDNKADIPTKFVDEDEIKKVNYKKRYLH